MCVLMWVQIWRRMLNQGQDEPQMTKDDVWTWPFSKSTMLLQGQVNELDVDILLDTGSQFTLIDKRIFNLLQDPKLHESHLRCIRGIAEAGKNVIAATSVDVFFAKNILTLTCHIVDDLPYDLLLGRDMLKHVLHTINYVDGVVTFFAGRREAGSCDCYVMVRDDNTRLSRVMCVTCAASLRRDTSVDMT